MMRFQFAAYLLATVLFLRSSFSQAQNNASGAGLYNQVSIASPTAASLGKFTDVPVSYHTGIPDISVPLYTIKEGSLTLPVSLSYHAGGIKVLETASWVGLNWALNAGGVITRSVMGAPDESGTTNATHCHFSDYGFSHYLTLGGQRPNNQAAPNDHEFTTNIYDGEPDLFFFNFNGYSGKFYFNDDRTPVIVDGQDIKIEYYYPHPGSSGGFGDGNIQGFVLTVPTGDRYYFGATADFANLPATVKPVEITYATSEDNSNITGQVFSSYYLHKIVAADGVHTITFDYEREKYSYYTLSTFPIPSNFVQNNNDPFSVPPKEFALVGNNLDGVRLTGIHFSTGNVAFLANTIRTDLRAFSPGSLNDSQNNDLQLQSSPAKALDQVRITSSAGNFCKQFTFSYSYYQAYEATLSSYLRTTTTPGINSDKTRLRLDKLAEQSCDGSQATGPWLFHYNGDHLPRRLSFAQDHWGFYNGAENNNQLNTLIPTYSFSQTPSVSNPNPPPGSQVPGANRDPAQPYMSAGMLTQVTYPTGGNAVFQFEPNDVWTNYTRWEYLNPLTMHIEYHSDYSAANHAEAPYTFQADSYYKLVVSYQRTGPCSQESAPTSALFGYGGPRSNPYPDVSLGGASYLNPHNEQTFSLAAKSIPPGPQTVRFDISSNCSGDRADVSLQQAVRRNVTENAYAGGLRIRTITLKPSATATDMVVTRYAYRFTDGHSTGALFTRPYY